MQVAYKSRPLGTLWLGDRLPDLERLCLTSMVEHGQDMTLFSYNPIAGVPDGIVQRDARAVMPDNPTQRDGHTLDPAKASDIWRLRMIRDLDLCWVDSDFFARGPFGGDTAKTVFVHTRFKTFANGLMYFRREDPLLRDYIAATEEAYPIHYYWPLHLLRSTIAARLRGEPVHMAQIPVSNVTGPKVFSHLVWWKLRFLDGLPRDMFIPFSWKQRAMIFRPFEEVEAILQKNERNCALHLWGSGVRQQIADRAYPSGCYVDVQMKRLGLA